MPPRLAGVSGEEVRVPIFQGGSKDYRRNTLLGIVGITGLDPAPRGGISGRLPWSFTTTWTVSSRSRSPRSSPARRARAGWLDLLRLLAARLAGARTTKSPALRASERRRPVLRAVNRALASSSEVIYFERQVRPISPRAEQVVVLARYVERHEHLASARRFMTRNFSEPLIALSPADGSGGLAGIESWLGGGEWSPNALDTKISVDERRRALARILAALHRRLSRGEVLGLWGPASAACWLASKLPGLRTLQRLIHTLHLELEWADPGTATPEPLIEALIARRPEAAAIVGREVMRSGITAPSLIPAGLAAAAQGGLNEAAAYIERLADPFDGDAISSLEFSRFLSRARVDPWHRGWFQVLYELELGQPRRPCTGPGGSSSCSTRPSRTRSGPRP